MPSIRKDTCILRAIILRSLAKPRVTMRILLSFALLLWHISSIHGFLRPLGPQSHSRLFEKATKRNTEQDLSSASSAAAVPSFILQAFLSECDNLNQPPSLSILLRTLQHLTQGSDIRGRFIDHRRLGNLASIAHEIGKHQASVTQPPLTPLAAYCIGAALGEMIQQDDDETETVVLVGQDPRLHGMRLADALARGLESNAHVKCRYTGLATTPGCAALCHLKPEIAVSIMVTASHLPADRNGFKISTREGFLTKPQLAELGLRAQQVCNRIYNDGQIPPTSGEQAVMCSEWVDYMPIYAESLQKAILREVGRAGNNEEQPLKGLKIGLNTGNGAGGFFASVLQDLGADVVGLHLAPDGSFPNAVPNPEYSPMIEETMRLCNEHEVDLGIMLDTDADRCGFVVPGKIQYEALNRNRLIALLGVLFAEQTPGAAFVTDSVTSEGLARFLTDKLGLEHIRYVKGYINVINKAKELVEAGTDVQVAIETSGHCAMRENHFLDDGTYTAVKVVSLLAKIKQKGLGLLDLIADLEELDEVAELRLELKDESLETMHSTFDFCALEIERACEGKWTLDTANLEGIRVKVGQGFFMVRKSLHDPIISLQIEATSREEARQDIVEPILKLFETEKAISSTLDLSVLRNY